MRKINECDWCDEPITEDQMFEFQRGGCDVCGAGRLCDACIIGHEEACPGDVSAKESIIKFLSPKWIPAPKGEKCLNCNSENVERSYIPMGGPFSGTVRCKDCNYTESVMSQIGKTCIEVKPLDDTITNLVRWRASKLDSVGEELVYRVSWHLENDPKPPPEFQEALKQFLALSHDIRIKLVAEILEEKLHQEDIIRPFGKALMEMIDRKVIEPNPGGMIKLPSIAWRLLEPIVNFMKENDE